MRLHHRPTILLILFGLVLSACGPQAAPVPSPVLPSVTVTVTPVPATSTPVPAPTFTALPGPWQVFAIHDEHQSIMTAGFLDETFGVTGGVFGYTNYTTDGGLTWPEGQNQSDCRYGLEVVSHDVAFTCGGMTHVRRSLDGGKTWQALAPFGDPAMTNPCHSMSFLGADTGWLATSTVFGATYDGGQTWNYAPLPAEANRIETVETYAPGHGYLLDQSGVLFFSPDDGRHWMLVARLDLGGLAMPKSAYQWAAMRFADQNHGMLVVAGQVDGADQVIAFHTADAGQTWTSELVPVKAGPLYLARNSGLLTVITGPNILTVMRYTAP
jgi:photosystem II stability/assembly factor-like uncharacterized protein